MASKIEIDDSTDAEKLDYVYRRMRAQERQEIANNVWKWIIRAIILISIVQTYFMFSGLMKSGLTGGAWALFWIPQESELNKILHNR